MTPARPARRLRGLAALVLALALSVTACTRADEGGGAPAADLGPAAELRLGFFPNVTHAPALIGVQNGLFAGQLGDTALSTQVFNAGPTEVNALLGGSLDVGFIGSGPAINAYNQNPEGIRVIAGSTSAGAQLVVRPDITTPQQLLGKRIATPQQGNTQDIALKKWLVENDLPQGTAASGAVEVVNLENARALEAFQTGEIDGGWLPEPFASRFVVEAGATQLLDERTLWPGGEFPTTVIIARTQFVEEHPSTVAAFLRGLVEAETFAAGDPAAAKTVVNQALEANGSRALPQPVIDRAWDQVTFGPDPQAASWPQLAQDAVTAGIATEPTDLAGVFDVGPLNQALTETGRPTVDAAGLDR